MPSNFKALAGAAGGGDLADPNFKNVTLLLHGDGSNGAQNNTFIDSSTNNFTITRNGNTTQGSFSPYGSNWSNYFDGSGDFLQVTGAALAFGSGSWTVEGWIFLNAYPGSYAQIFDTRFNGHGSTAGLTLYVNSTGSLRVYQGTDRAYTSSTISLGTWTHFAAVYDGTTLKLYLNGSNTGATNYTTSFNLTNTTLQIGAEWTTTAGFINASISNFRVLVGTALYTANFTPPTQPLTAISGTALLTCQSNRFRDGSANNFAITRVGDVKVTNFAPFAPSSAYSTTTNGGSAYFDGSGDWLNTPSSLSLTSGTDFTLEFWLYPFAAFSSNRGLVAIDGGRFGLITEGGSIYFLSNSTEFDSNVNPVPGAWNHIALTRTSGTIRLFLNGTQIATASSNTDNWSSQGLRIGSNSGGEIIPQCYMSDVRWATTSFYSSAFTPPTAPLTAASGTQVLVGCKNAAIFDNSMKNDLETVGNAQISTSVKKFGTGSIYIPGRTPNSYLITYPPVPGYGIGTGNFTFEAWVYLLGTNNWQAFFECRNGGGYYFGVNQSTRNPYVIGSDGFTLNASPSTIPLNTWTHMAFVRNNGTLKIYMDGTEIASASTSINVASTYVCVGGDIGNLSVDGYIDDARITAGVARYTANFTPPTTPFPNK